MSDYKILAFKDEARKKLAAGADKLANAVVSTLGPRSRNVALNRQYPGPVVLHDGVSVAREIRLKDPFEDMGAVLVHEAASRTNDLAGDGTTTATLLANTLVQEGLKMVGGGIMEGIISESINPMVVREKLEGYASVIMRKLEERAVKLEKREDYEKVASVSSGSKDIGKMVADAVEKVGKEGVIMVEEDAKFESSLEIQEGMEFDNGYLSPYFVTDADKMIAEYFDGYVLLTNHHVFSAEQLVPIVTKVMANGNKPLLIIADDVVGPALQALILTKLNPKTRANLIAVIAPEYADRRKEMLEDLAVLTGGDLISKELEHKLEAVELKQLGRFRSIKVSQTHTTIVPKNPDNEEITERVNAIKSQIELEENAFRKERLEYRLGKLSGKVAIIKVGGSSQVEIKEKKERFIDAVHATKAALAEGIISGGGIALKEIANEITDTTPVIELVKKALYAPFERIITNAGESVSDVQKLIDLLPDTVKNRGYDVVAQRAGDMLSMGIVDPVKVTKLGIQHSFSVAGMILTTDTLVSDDVEEDRKVKTA